MSMSKTPDTPIETAPSAVVIEGPALARLIGFAGLFLLIFGIVVVVATRAVGPRWIPEGAGFLFGAFGLVMMLYHAITDGDQDIRRMYGGLTAFLLLAAVCMSILPGPFDTGAEQRAGYYLLPWGVSAWLLCLLFAVPFCRHETDELYRKLASLMLLSVGGILSVGSVAAGIFKPDFLVGPGITLALLGLGFLCAYLGQTDTSEGIGYTVACTLGAVGAAVLFYAIARAAFPNLLYDGPNSLRKPDGKLDKWLVLLRLLVAAAFAAPAIAAFLARSQLWLKAALSLVAVTGVGVVITSMTSNPVAIPPTPFLVPSGLILAAIGLIYFAVALGICSDNQMVTLTRRELSSYFLSPIGYLVLCGMVLIHWIGYREFILTLASSGGGPTPQPIPEPIVEFSLVAIFPVFAMLLCIPVLTMRLMSEEKRSGSLEVLLTAPVNEWPIVLSKFLATWLFFLLTWLPVGLFMIALRVEVGAPFDYRPLLGFYVCLAAQGLAFVGMGLFFSTLTKNQVIAAVLTFAGMVLFLLFFFIKRETAATGIPSFLQTIIVRLSFLSMWQESLAGRLPIRDVLLYSSLGVFWLFLSVKVLEIRKWN
jgi:ABC-2 type transport system permease protein